MDVEISGEGKKDWKLFPQNEKERVGLNMLIEEGLTSGQRYCFRGKYFKVVGLCFREGKPLEGGGLHLRLIDENCPKIC